MTAVEPGSAAAGAGFRVGDRIVQFGGMEVSSPETFRAVVLAVQNPVVARIKRSDREEPIELTLTLPGTPSRLGITSATDDAEPDAVILNRVLPGSPADSVGLKVNDRIYQIDGRNFASAEEFRERVKAAQGPLELTVDSRGQVRKVTLQPTNIGTTPGG